MVPTAEDCYKLMDKYGMLDNIKAHSIVVEKVARIIAKGFIEAGIDLSLEKVTAGALMHDIGKTLCLNTQIDHAPKGKEICLRNNLEEIAEIVDEHITLQNYDKDGPVQEKEIIYYSDKRVNHDTVVSLDERLVYLLGRYAQSSEEMAHIIRENIERCREVEKKLFAVLEFTPEELAVMIQQE
ncbi:HDIG domain-containing metalloprotein [Thermodesulfobacteriota bacterium]